MEHILNAFKSDAAALDHLQGPPRLAIVASVDTSSACVRVMHQPENLLSGWLPVLSLWTGAGWGLACMPSPGDQVLVLAHDGDAANGVVLGALFSDDRQTPAAPAGEFWLVHAGGSSLKLLNDGSIQIVGDLHVAGDVYDKLGPLSRLRSSYNTHIHDDAVGRVTSGPTPADV